MVKRVIKEVYSSYWIKLRILPIDEYPNGYNYVNFNVDGKRTTQLVHRLVLMAFNPVENMGFLKVNFKDENINNLDLSNLEWCTSKENANYGTRNFRCKINNPQLIKVVQLTKDF
ncbi:HNH endonuclease [Clostridium gasigenes]|nr:HNH endonuclease [Clostridium gasigenes]